MERRLAAILTADVVGYSRLMGDDEAGTLARLDGLKAETIDPLVGQHHGRIVKLMGDGFLIEFGSVVDALECAIAWQEAVEARARLVPEDKAIRFRIGINLGDVIFKGNDVFGDGVNVAARLEAMAEPGDILVSRTVANHVKGKITPGFEDLGNQQLKNISEPVQVFRVVPPPDAEGRTTTTRKSKRYNLIMVMAAGLATLVLVVGGVLWLRPWGPRVEPASVERMAFALPDKPSIAVLPFGNLSDDPAQEYFADGITEDLITDLSKISGLFVIARNSSFSYKGRQVKVRQVAEELGVRYVLEGSIRRAGDQVRINAQLIDATTGGHLWAERYDGSNTDVFALQDKVTKNIVNALAVTLTPQEAQSVAKAGTDSPAAHDAYLLGLSHYNRRTAIDNSKAKTQFEKAIQLDADYSAAYTALAKVYVRAIFGMRDYAEKLGFDWFTGTSKPWKYLQEAKANPDKDYFIVRSRLALRRHQLERAIAEAKRALELSSNDAEAMEALAEALIFSGRATEGTEYAHKAMRQNPTQPGRPLYLIGLAEFSEGNNEAAVKFLTRAIRIAPKETSFSGILAAAYGELGQTALARAALEEFNQRLDSQLFLHNVVSQYPISKASVLERLANGLKAAGMSVRSGEFMPLHAENKLTGPEIKALLFGTQIKGKLFWEGIYAGFSSSGDWRQQRRADGTVQHFGSSIQPGVSKGDTGAGRIERDMLCEIWPKLAKDLELCVVVFRITERVARIKWGDYVMVTDSGPNPFSPVN